MNEFWAMGGYARYLWPSFAITLGIVVWNIHAARQHYLQGLAAARRRASTGESQS